MSLVIVQQDLIGILFLMTYLFKNDKYIDSGHLFAHDSPI